MKKINKDVYFRFEPNLGDEGELIVYFKKSGELFEMTEPYYIFLKGIEESAEELLSTFSEKYPSLKTEEILENIKIIKSELLELGILQ